MHQENNPKLSIVIPVFNEENFLSKLFTELKNHFNNYETEIIIVNDGLTDNSENEIINLRKFKL